MVVRRIVKVPLIDGTDPAPILEAARAAFPTIPGVIGFHAGQTVSGDALCLLVDFADLEAVPAYRAHAVHVDFVETWLKPNMTGLEAENYIIA